MEERIKLRIKLYCYFTYRICIANNIGFLPEYKLKVKYVLWNKDETKMFKIKKNPIDAVIRNFDRMNTLFEGNHIKKNQDLIISLGIRKDEEVASYNYTMNFSFLNFKGYEPNKAPRILTIPFDIIETNGFTAENAQIASMLFLQYLKEDYSKIEQYVKYVWAEYNINLKVITKLPEELKAYVSPSELKEIEQNTDEISQ